MCLQMVFIINGAQHIIEEDVSNKTTEEMQIVAEEIYWSVINDAEAKGLEAIFKKVIKIP